MTASPQPLDPLVHSRRLRAGLRRAREEAKLTRQQVVDDLDWSLSKLVRIEAGAVSVSKTDVQALLHKYGIREQTAASLMSDARESRRPSWWQPFRDILSAEFIVYLGSESSATRIRQFHTVLVPGLLQTEGYGRAVIAATRGHDKIDRRWEARRQRQNLLDRHDGPAMHFVLDEVALLRPVGGADVMREQVLHLRRLSRRSNVTLQVVPLTQGAHAGLNGPFVLLDIGAEALAYLETPNAGLLSRNEDGDVARYQALFDELAAAATPPDEVDGVLDRALVRLGAVGLGGGPTSQ